MKCWINSTMSRIVSDSAFYYLRKITLKYARPKSMSSFHVRCGKAADDLAEEKKHVLNLDSRDNVDAAMAQIRVYLCTRYNFSANSSLNLIDEYLEIAKG